MRFWVPMPNFAAEKRTKIVVVNMICCEACDKEHEVYVTKHLVDCHRTLETLK